MTQTAPSPTGTGALAGQTVVVLGGSSGIGLETARLARTAGAQVVLTGRDPDRLARAAADVGALSTATLDLADAAGQASFFAGLPGQIDHVLVSGGGPAYGPIAELDLDEVGRNLGEHLVGSLRIARECVGRVRPGGSLTFITGTGARRPAVGIVVAAIGTAALSAITANVALELAPLRANAIAAGFVDTPLSARILGDELENRRDQLRATLPIRRVVGPQDVAALALHLMTNTALTGATFDVDGGQQLLRE
ncbi:MAG TPA: SDR family oxidoreductase [Mycobacteriales bacterium]|jgi:NAD(P)-dependent dehydrogenase (short-subunit alcohol dehydrogenase family)|nr:SDR family oxidoreductase [Mycobacteriales bacterium]